MILMVFLRRILIFLCKKIDSIEFRKDITKYKDKEIKQKIKLRGKSLQPIITDHFYGPLRDSSICDTVKDKKKL